MSKHPRPESYTLIQEGVGQRMQWVRELVMPNRAEAARLMGVDSSTLAKIESGDRPPSIFNVLDYANRFRVSTDFLLRGLLVARTDEEMALLLAAQHPELVSQLARKGEGMDTAQAPCTLPKPKKPRATSR